MTPPPPNRSSAENSPALVMAASTGSGLAASETSCATAGALPPAGPEPSEIVDQRQSRQFAEVHRARLQELAQAKHVTIQQIAEVGGERAHQAGDILQRVDEEVGDALQRADKEVVEIEVDICGNQPADVDGYVKA